MTEIDRLVHEPARLQILSHLYVLEEADFLFLRRRLSMTQGNLSSHMSKLEKVGYVAIEKTDAGRNSNTRLRLTESGREAVRRYAQQMQQILAGLIVESPE